MGSYQKEKYTLDTISLRATSRSSVRLAPKIPNYVMCDPVNDIVQRNNQAMSVQNLACFGPLTP